MSLFGGLFGKKPVKQQKRIPSPTPEEIAKAEDALRIKFPSSYLTFMRTAGVQPHDEGEFCFIGDEIILSNHRERAIDYNSLPDFLVGFYDDGMGNQLCFDTRHPDAGGEYPIVFWDHELDTEENLQASARTADHPERAGIVASNFPAWLEQRFDRKPQSIE